MKILSNQLEQRVHYHYKTDEASAQDFYPSDSLSERTAKLNQFELRTMASSMISTATTAVSRSTPAQANMVAPFTGLKSVVSFPVTRKNADITSVANNGGRVSCMQVWPPVGLLKFETLSYLPPLSREQLIKQIDYLLRLKLIPCLEFTLGCPVVYREFHASPGYYDGRYWTMWKLPMFGCTDAVQVVNELDEAVKAYPTACHRVIGFDNVRQVQIISFLAVKAEGV